MDPGIVLGRFRFVGSVTIFSCFGSFLKVGPVFSFSIFYSRFWFGVRFFDKYMQLDKLCSKPINNIATSNDRSFLVTGSRIIH